jgi:uncharacterized protein (DUF2267 family)
MSTLVDSFDKTLQKTVTWLDELSAALGWPDRQRAYTALRVTLHALRDRLPPGEALHLAAQLPILVRGFYFEGWKPSRTPVRIRHLEEFLAPISQALASDWATPPEEVVREVFALLARHVSSGEMEDVAQALPAPLRELMPADLRQEVSIDA